MASLLILEDSPFDRELYKKILGSLFECRFSCTVEEFLNEAEHCPPDLCILDVQLEEGDGFQALSKFLENPERRDVPIFMVSAESDLHKRVLGIKLGADDYITKPFEALELRAKIETKLSKKKLASEGASIIRSDGFHLDIHRYTLSFDNEAKTIELSTLDCRLLRYLMENPDRVLSRQQLLDHVWGDSVHVSDRNIDTRVSTLRKTLGEHGKRIETVYGAGYRLRSQLKKAA